jgi:hypothetical protein
MAIHFAAATKQPKERQQRSVPSVKLRFANPVQPEFGLSPDADNLKLRFPYFIAKAITCFVC